MWKMGTWAQRARAMGANQKISMSINLEGLHGGWKQKGIVTVAVGAAASWVHCAWSATVPQCQGTLCWLGGYQEKSLLLHSRHAPINLPVKTVLRSFVWISLAVAHSARVLRVQLLCRGGRTSAQPHGWYW